MVEEETRGKDWQVKVIERAGLKLMHQLPSLKESMECGKDDCIMHTTGGRGSCRKEGVVYKGILGKGPGSEPDWDGKVRQLMERKPSFNNTWPPLVNPLRTRKMPLSGIEKTFAWGRRGRSSTNLNQ